MILKKKQKKNIEEYNENLDKLSRTLENSNMGGNDFEGKLFELTKKNTELKEENTKLKHTIDELNENKTKLDVELIEEKKKLNAEIMSKKEIQDENNKNTKKYDRLKELYKKSLNDLKNYKTEFVQKFNNFFDKIKEYIPVDDKYKNFVLSEDIEGSKQFERVGEVLDHISELFEKRNKIYGIIQDEVTSNEGFVINDKEIQKKYNKDRNELGVFVQKIKSELLLNKDENNYLKNMFLNIKKLYQEHYKNIEEKNKEKELVREMENNISKLNDNAKNTLGTV